MPLSRFIVGIDLGTSNSALTYIDTLEDSMSVHTLEIEQQGAQSTSEHRTMLPSNMYLPELENAEPIVGHYALERASEVPGRVVHSAKSWLCHRGIDPLQSILPWGSSECSLEEKKSPVAVSGAYLRHLKSCWDAEFAAFESEYQLERQSVIITVPASFDIVAQQLTLLAAAEAGLSEELPLLEEPQAAFYHWLSSHKSDLHSLANSGAQTVLVCDIGGGTSDFSLFSITAPKGEELPVVERVAVSEHLLLGGDNIDIAIARRLEQQAKASGHLLKPRQWSELVIRARRLKEQALEDEAAEDASLHIALSSAGSDIFASSLSLSISKSEVRSLVLDGFFPEIPAGEKVERSRVGLREFGLPYAADSRITAHIAEFLASGGVDAVLYTGGTLKPAFLRRRLTELITSWQNGKVPRVLENDAMELAVAKGAAWYGLARRRNKGRILAGSAHCVYLAVSGAGQNGISQLVCVLPKGSEPGSVRELKSLPLRLRVNEPVQFQAFHSRLRNDEFGALIPLSESLSEPLPPLQTRLTLPQGAKRPKSDLIDIWLEIELSETGLLQLHCVQQSDVQPQSRWKLEFNLRALEKEQEASEDSGAELSEALQKRLLRAEQAILSVYGKPKQTDKTVEPKKLPRRLEELLAMPREAWNVTLLRSLWPSLEKGITRRGRSRGHEHSWLFLAGYLLRPGFGAPLDQFRVDELWRAFELGLAHPKEKSVQVQWWIMWRRVAGGLSAERQRELYNSFEKKLMGKGDLLPELCALAGSLERLPLEEKIRLGDTLCQWIARRAEVQERSYVWALTRIAARELLYAGTDFVVPPEIINRWFSGLSALDWRERARGEICSLFIEAARCSPDRFYNLREEDRERIAEKLRSSGVPDTETSTLFSYRPRKNDLGQQLLGEALPAGLLLAA